MSINVMFVKIWAKIFEANNQTCLQPKISWTYLYIYISIYISIPIYFSFFFHRIRWMRCWKPRPLCEIKLRDHNAKWGERWPRIKSREGRLSQRLGRDQSVWRRGCSQTLAFFALRLTFNKVRIWVTGALRRGPRISAQPGRVGHYLAAQCNCVIVTAGRRDLRPISSVIAHVQSQRVRAPMCTCAHVRVCVCVWKVTWGARICMCQLLWLNICNADISFRHSAAPSPPRSISTAEWHDNVVLRVLLKGLAQISISRSIWTGCACSGISMSANSSWDRSRSVNWQRGSGDRGEI